MQSIAFINSNILNNDLYDTTLICITTPPQQLEIYKTYLKTIFECHCQEILHICGLIISLHL